MSRVQERRAGRARAGAHPAGRAGVPGGGAGAVPGRRHLAPRPARARLQAGARLHALPLRQVRTDLDILYRFCTFVSEFAYAYANTTDCTLHLLEH